MSCAICHVRRPRRFCAGVRGEICTMCCGTEREVSIDCPLDCVYLQEAHQHERKERANPQDFPNQDIRVTEEFIRDQEPFVMFLAHSLLDAALANSGATDFDVRDALDALIRTYRTLESGLYYETRPDNLVAANISRRLQTSIDEFRKQDSEKTGMRRIRDADILTLLVFLQRLELDNNNGRKRSRGCLDFLGSLFSDAPAGAVPAGRSLIVL